MPEEVIGSIQGIVPDSVYEWRVSKSLDKFGWDYQYQAPVAGGRNRRGGQVIDFLIGTVPTQTALYVQGPYYHGTKQAQIDQLKQAYTFSVMEYQVVVMETKDLETQEQCDSEILDQFGRNK